MTIQTAGRIFAPSLSSFLTTRRPFAGANVPRHCYPDDAPASAMRNIFPPTKVPKRSLLCKQARPSTPGRRALRFGRIRGLVRPCATLCDFMPFARPYTGRNVLRQRTYHAGPTNPGGSKKRPSLPKRHARSLHCDTLYGGMRCGAVMREQSVRGAIARPAAQRNYCAFFLRW